MDPLVRQLMALNLARDVAEALSEDVAGLDAKIAVLQSLAWTASGQERKPEKLEIFKGWERHRGRDEEDPEVL